MKLQHIDSYETDIYVNAGGHIRIQQIHDGEESVVFITDTQAIQIKKLLPELIKFQSQIKNEQLQNVDQEEPNDEG